MMTSLPRRPADDALRAVVERLSDDEIDLADFFRRLHDLARDSGEETFSLSERPVKTGAADFVLASAAASATVGEAMRAIARAYNFLHGGDYNLVEAHACSLSYVVDDEGFPYTVPRDEFLHFSLECSLIVMHAALCHMAGVDLTGSLKRVSTRRPAGRTRTDQALTFWGLPVRHGAPHYAITYDASVAARPLALDRHTARPQAALHTAIVTLIEGRLAHRHAPEPLGVTIARTMADGVLSQAAIARRLGLSVATLRRRLDAQGEGFRRIRERVLSERARWELKRTPSVSRAAEALGFSDSRSFSRAFQAWTGMTPAAFIRSSGARATSEA